MLLAHSKTPGPATLNVAGNIFGHQKMLLETLNVAGNIFGHQKMLLETFNVAGSVVGHMQMLMDVAGMLLASNSV